MLLLSLDADLGANKVEVEEKMKSKFKSLCETNLPEVNYVDKPRVIVSLDQLLKLKGPKCELCKELLSFSWSGKGTVRILTWQCKNKHQDRWVSSEIIDVRNKTPIYLNDLLFTSYVALTGNNWCKCNIHFSEPKFVHFS